MKTSMKHAPLHLSSSSPLHLSSFFPPPPSLFSPPFSFIMNVLLACPAPSSAPLLSQIHRSRSSPEGMSSVSPPISPLPRSPILHTFSISKLAGLGVLISGGVNKPDGPHILIEKVLDGMDAAKVTKTILHKRLHCYWRL